MHPYHPRPRKIVEVLTQHERASVVRCVLCHLRVLLIVNSYAESQSQHENKDARGFSCVYVGVFYQGA